jgi:hypothetical protein
LARSTVAAAPARTKLAATGRATEAADIARDSAEKGTPDGVDVPVGTNATKGLRETAVDDGTPATSDAPENEARRAA